RREGGQRHRLCPGHLEAEDPLGAGRLGDGGLGGCLLGRRVGLWRVPRHLAALDAHYRGGAAGTLRRLGAISARGDSARHPGVLATRTPAAWAWPCPRRTVAGPAPPGTAGRA